MDIVLLGIQGSGKGTLSKIVAEKYGFEVFETGSQLRRLAHQNSALAKKVQSIIRAGRLVPNVIVMNIIENFMAKLPKAQKVLFDGIPRKMVQAKTFDALMKKLGRDFIGILIDVPEKVVLKRLVARRICQNCKAVYPAFYKKNACKVCGGQLVARGDDNPESIKTRIQAFYKETTPVTEHYKKTGKLFTMNGDQSIEAAGKTILKILEKKFSPHTTCVSGKKAE